MIKKDIKLSFQQGVQPNAWKSLIPSFSILQEGNSHHCLLADAQPWSQWSVWIPWKCMMEATCTITSLSWMRMAPGDHIMFVIVNDIDQRVQFERIHLVLLSSGVHNWGKPERAPHKRWVCVQCIWYIYVWYVHHPCAAINILYAVCDIFQH